MPNKTPQQRVFKDLDGVYAMGKTLQALADGNFHVQVGIFGDSARDKAAAPGEYAKNKPKKSTIKSAGAGELTNAQIGFIHEMGSSSRGIPRRSFLWDTLRDRGAALMSIMHSAAENLFKPGMAEIAAGGEAGSASGEGKVMKFLKQAGLAAENLVQMAFQTGGFGKWIPTKNIKSKGTHLTLVETHQLRQSIASRVRRA